MEVVFFNLIFTPVYICIYLGFKLNKLNQVYEFGI